MLRFTWRNSEFKAYIHWEEGKYDIEARYPLRKTRKSVLSLLRNLNWIEEQSAWLRVSIKRKYWVLW